MTDHIRMNVISANETMPPEEATLPGEEVFRDHGDVYGPDGETDGGVDRGGSRRGSEYDDSSDGGCTWEDGGEFLGALPRTDLSARRFAATFPGSSRCGPQDYPLPEPNPNAPAPSGNQDGYGVPSNDPTSPWRRGSMNDAKPPKTLV